MAKAQWAVLERNDRLRVYIAGGFTGGLMNEPVDITLDQIPDDAFERAKQIVKLLTAKTEALTPEEHAERSKNNGAVGDFGYFVEAGDYGTPEDKLSTIFMGSFRPTPEIIQELETLLKAHATPEDLVLKP